MNCHLLDANVFIDAKNTYYSFETAPGFWSWLRDEHTRGTICSITAVHDELARQEDELAEWAQTLPKTFWLHEDDATLPHLQTVASWAMDPAHKYREAARTEFLAAADFRLVAAARAWTMPIATNEVSQPDSGRKVKLPDACHAQNVEVTRGHILFRRLGLRLVQSRDQSQ